MKKVVLILCGGKGSRLGERGTKCPKVLTPVQGRPMLHHIINQLVEQGFEKFIFGTGFLANQVEEYVTTEFPNVESIFSNAGDNASMLQRFFHAKDFLNDQFVVCYGDTFIDTDFSQLLDNHVRSKKQATIVTSAFQNPFGLVTFEPNSYLLNSFHEKPTVHYYIGSLAMSKNTVEKVSPHLLELPDGQGLIALFQDLIANKQLNSHPHQGLQVTFNTEGEIPGAEEALRTYYTLKEAE